MSDKLDAGRRPGSPARRTASEMPVTQGNGPEIVALRRNVPCDQPDDEPRRYCTLLHATIPVVVSLGRQIPLWGRRDRGGLSGAQRLEPARWGAWLLALRSGGGLEGSGSSTGARTPGCGHLAPVTCSRGRRRGPRHPRRGRRPVGENLPARPHLMGDDGGLGPPLSSTDLPRAVDRL